MTPHDIVAGFMAGMFSRLRDWRKHPRTPLPPYPDNDATRLIAYLTRGGYVIVPVKPTAVMIAAGDEIIWREMIAAWESELKRTRRLGALDFSRLPSQMQR